MAGSRSLIPGSAVLIVRFEGHGQIAADLAAADTLGHDTALHVNGDFGQVIAKGLEAVVPQGEVELRLGTVFQPMFGDTAPARLIASRIRDMASPASSRVMQSRL